MNVVCAHCYRPISLRRIKPGKGFICRCRRKRRKPKPIQEDTRG